MTEREQRIFGIVRQLSEAQPEAVPLEQALFATGILDSFALPDLVAELEKEFAVQIPDSDLLPANFRSIRAIDSYLAAKT